MVPNDTIILEQDFLALHIHWKKDIDYLLMVLAMKALFRGKRTENY